jgi:hypothetical protein
MTTSTVEQKTQPWKKFWPPQDGTATQIDLTPEEMNLQRSYGTHASNTKGKIFAIDNKPKCKCRILLYFFLLKNADVLPFQQSKEWSLLMVRRKMKRERGGEERGERMVGLPHSFGYIKRTSNMAANIRMTII